MHLDENAGIMSFSKETRRSVLTLPWIALAVLFGPLSIWFLIFVSLLGPFYLVLLFGSIEVATMLPTQQQSSRLSPMCLVFF